MIIEMIVFVMPITTFCSRTSTFICNVLASHFHIELVDFPHLILTLHI
jgi:hypothetical protein